jgi:hypothetical protein
VIEEQFFKNLTQDTMRMHELLLFFHVLAKHTKLEEKTLMDYLQFHVMTSVEYLVVICKKVMEKAIEKVISETHCKEMEENKVKNL